MREDHDDLRSKSAAGVFGGGQPYRPGERQARLIPPPNQPHSKDPKQEAGMAKVPFHALPFAVLAEDAVAHGEGAQKYGRHNWREGDVLASTYFAAAMRHLCAWYEGEDIDPESGLSHLVKARASLGVLRDAQIQGRAIDDRPAPSPAAFLTQLNEATVDMTRRVAKLKEGK